MAAIFFFLVGLVLLAVYYAAIMALLASPFMLAFLGLKSASDKFGRWVVAATVLLTGLSLFGFFIWSNSKDLAQLQVNTATMVCNPSGTAVNKSAIDYRWVDQETVSRAMGREVVTGANNGSNVFDLCNVAKEMKLLTDARLIYVFYRIGNSHDTKCLDEVILRPRATQKSQADNKNVNFKDVSKFEADFRLCRGAYDFGYSSFVLDNVDKNSEMQFYLEPTSAKWE
jgi:hypothetical protein